MKKLAKEDTPGNIKKQQNKHTRTHIHTKEAGIFHFSLSISQMKFKKENNTACVCFLSQVKQMIAMPLVYVHVYIYINEEFPVYKIFEASATRVAVILLQR